MLKNQKCGPGVSATRCYVGGNSSARCWVVWGWTASAGSTVLLAQPASTWAFASPEDSAAEQRPTEPDPDEETVASESAVEPADVSAEAQSGSEAPPRSAQAFKPKPEPEPEPQVQRRHMRSFKIPRTGRTQMWARWGSYTDYFGNNYNGLDNDDRLVAHVNQLSLGSRSNFANWTYAQSARIDTHNVFGTQRGSGIYLCDINSDGEVSLSESESCTYRPDYRLERLTARLDFKHVTLTLGDFNVNFGRGLGLSVRKIASIGVDATIKGARFDVDIGPVEATALVGMANGQHSDYATRKLQRDPGYPAGRCAGVEGREHFGNQNFAGNPLWATCSDFVTGGQLRTKLPAKIRLGGHYTYFNFGIVGGGIEPADVQRLHLFGGDISRARIAGAWDMFIGAVGLVRNPHLAELDPDNDDRYTGMGVYTQHNIDVGNTLVTLEGKWYDNYYVQGRAGGLAYVEAPTAERADQQVNGVYNALGGRIQVDHIWREIGLTVYANMMAYAYAVNPLDDTFDAGEKGYLALHPYAGFRWSKPNSSLKVQASGGYRHERHNASPDDEAALFARKFPHGEFYVAVPLGDGGGFAHALGLRGEFRRETKRVSRDLDNRFVKGNLILEYSMSPYLNIGFVGGFSSEFVGVDGEPALEAKPCAQDEDGTYICRRKPHLWPGAEVRVNFLGTSFVRLFVGRQVGGRICVNGSCRDLPDFEGVRGELNLSF